jgi:hypothetical protein
LVVEVVSETDLPHPDGHPGDTHPNGSLIDCPLRNAALSADTKHELVVDFKGPKDMYARS